MRAIAKILRARATEYLSKFCEKIEQRPNFASSWKFFMTIRMAAITRYHKSGFHCSYKEILKGKTVSRKT